MANLLDGQKYGDDEAPMGALPVYMQIAEHIARQISAGHLLADSKLPPERDMAKQYDVAVGTLRKSLAHLTKIGLLARKQGSGNYITRNEHAASLYNFFRLELPQGGGLPSARLLDVTKLKKPDELPLFGTASFAHRFRRVRYLDKTPVALEEIWLDGAYAKAIEADDVSQSLYHYYQQELDLIITKVEDSITLAPPPVWYKPSADELDMTMMGYIERFGWSQKEQKVEYSRTWFAPSRARYVSRLK